jgi:hypothetical protein
MSGPGMSSTARLQVLQVPGCPHAAVLVSRLRLLTRGRPRVETRLIHDQAEAQARGMTGSPTMLIDGTDPFPAAGPPGLSCRLYPDETGSLYGSPSLTQLRTALAARGIGPA